MDAGTDPLIPRDNSPDVGCERGGSTSSGIFELSDPIKADYDSIFNEPEFYKETGLGKYVSRPLSTLFRGIFNNTQNMVYYYFVTIFGIPFSLFWAIILGVYTFSLIWLTRPVIRMLHHAYSVTMSITNPFCRIFFDPFFRSAGLALSSIQGKFRLSVSGLGQLVRHSNMSAGREIETI